MNSSLNVTNNVNNAASAKSYAETSAKNAALSTKEGVKESTKFSSANLKMQLNVSIVESSFSLSLKSGNQAMSLLYRSVSVSINEALNTSSDNKVTEPKLAENGEDISAEATAGRILQFALGGFEAYAKRHSKEEPEKMATDFVALIRGAFEKGFNEAKEILTSLQALNSAIETDINKTFALVTKGFDDFLAGKIKPANPATNPANTIKDTKS